MVDSTAPLAPTLDSAVSLSPTSVTLKWLPPYDAVGVTDYHIYRNDSLLATTPNATPEYTDSSVSAGTTYTYKIKARDAAANASADSNTITVTTRTAPTADNQLGRVEVDFGTTPVVDATFTVTDAAITPGSHIIAQIAWEAPTSKDIDEIEMDDINLRCQPAAGSFTIFAHAVDGSYLADKFKINYLVR